MKKIIATGACAALLVVAGVSNVAVAASNDDGFANDTAKRSYALGMNIGESAAKLPVEVDADALAQGVRDVVSGATPKLAEQEAKTTFQALMRDVRAAQLEKAKTKAAANKKAGDELLAKNKTKDGVKVT